MIELHGKLFALGLAAGAIGAGFYFAGLAIGLRLALARPATTPILLASAALRIALLLAFGLSIARLGGAALAGFVIAFLAVRLIVLATVRPAGATPVRAEERAPWS